MWKNRHQLPSLKKLDFQIDIEKLQRAVQEFSTNKSWDGLGAEYAGLCETHTKLPKMFFKEEELEGVERVCDMDWNRASYQQLSMTAFNESYELSGRSEKSRTAWDDRIAKGKKIADERWYNKRSTDLPQYIHNVLDKIGSTHRTRLARLAPFSNVKPHIDYDTTYSIRLHIAIETNDQCINGAIDSSGNTIETHIPADGSVWFINPGVKHWARNDGPSPRTHLIISVDSQELIKGIV